jgi:hypothetical protein
MLNSSSPPDISVPSFEILEDKDLKTFQSLKAKFVSYSHDLKHGLERELDQI